MIQIDLSNKKNTYWMGMLVYNGVVTLEALLYSIMVFSAYPFSSFSGILAIVYVLTYWGHAVIGFFMKTKPKYITVYLAINLTCRILAFWFTTGYLFATSLITMWFFLGSNFFLYLYYVYLGATKAFIAWYIINLLLAFGGTVLIITYRNMAREEETKQGVNNLDFNALNSQSPLTSQPHSQSGPGQYTNQQYNPNVQMQAGIPPEGQYNPPPQYTPNAQPQYNPNQPQYNPNQPQYNPNQQQYNQNQPQYNPNQPQYNPNQPQYNPNQQQYNPNPQPQYNPNPQSQPVSNPNPQPQSQPQPIVSPVPQQQAPNTKANDVKVQINPMNPLQDLPNDDQ